MEQINTTKLGKTLFLFDEGEKAEPDISPLQTKIINHINKTQIWKKDDFDEDDADPDLIDFLIEEGDIKFNKRKRKYEWISK
tara:strand:+ start:49 stop:294 length:246 start_codon:yes stop_codon:yes gene_type:complete